MTTTNIALNALTALVREGRSLRTECANISKRIDGRLVNVGGFCVCVSSTLGFERGSTSVARFFSQEDAEVFIDSVMESARIDAMEERAFAQRVVEGF